MRPLRHCVVELETVGGENEQQHFFTPLPPTAADAIYSEGQLQCPNRQYWRRYLAHEGGDLCGVVEDRVEDGQGHDDVREDGAKV